MRIRSVPVTLVALATFFLAAVAVAQSRPFVVDVCVDPTTDFRTDAHNIAAVGGVYEEGTIPAGGSPGCALPEDKRIGTFFTRGSIVQGSPAAAEDDFAHVDWHLRIEKEVRAVGAVGTGVIDTTGLVKSTSPYPQTVVGATGVFKDRFTKASTEILDGVGFQVRLAFEK